MKTIRCSSLPRLAACAAAGEPPETWVEPLSEGADLGSAFHEAIATTIKGGEPDLDDVACRFEVDVDDLRPLYFWAKSQWETNLKPHFPDPIVEEALRVEDEEMGLTLTGHPDVLALADDELRGLDHKSGWLNVDSAAQMRGYAVLGFCRWPEATKARMSILRLRERTVETFVWSREEVMQVWWTWLAAHLRRPEQYHPGGHCGFCPRALECPAHRQHLQASIQMLETTETPEALAPDNLADAVLRAKGLERRLKSFLEAAKAYVIAEGGVYGPLRITATERRTIDFPACHEVLVETIGRERLLPILKVGKGDVEKAVKETAARGNKGRVVAALMERLEGLGAFNVSISHKLEIDHGTAHATDESPEAIGGEAD